MQIWFNDEPLARKCRQSQRVSALLTQRSNSSSWRCAGAQSTHPAARPVGNISCRKARSGPCFFRLSLEADMLCNKRQNV